MTDKVFFDIEIGDEAIGRVVMGLYGKTVRATVLVERVKGALTDWMGQVPKKSTVL